MAENANDMKKRREEILKTLIEGKKMEAYAEYRTRDMHACFFCERVFYKKPKKRIGNKWVCMECLRQLREAIMGFEMWEKEVELEAEIKKKFDEELGV